MRSSNKELYPFIGREEWVGVILMVLVLNGVVGGRASSPTEVEIEEHLRKLNKPAVKTIVSEVGDIIDCVDIYKQPSFDHPLLKNHTIEMKPSFYPIMEEGNFSFVGEVEQIWQNSGSCPDGTIPIKRTRRSDLLRAGSFGNFGVNEPENCKIEFARGQVLEGGYLGVNGFIPAWKIQVEADEWSLNSIAVVNVDQSYLETGLAVSPILFGDDRTRIYIRWRTEDGKGCFNLNCPGFVQISKRYMLGSAVGPLSKYGGKQFGMNFVIYKDNIQGKWWFMCQGVPVGYWPASLFPDFNSGSEVQWGGSVCDTQTGGYHTTTQMGSGHFPREGFTRASVIEKMQVMGGDKQMKAAKNIKYASSYNGCYRVSNGGWLEGPCIFYGGPGGKCCDARCTT